MSAFTAYLIGAIVLAGGLSFAAFQLGAPPIWIGIGALIVLGMGIMSAAAKTKQKDLPEES